MPLVQQFALLAGDVEFRSHFLCFITGVFDLLMTVIPCICNFLTPRFLKTGTSYLISLYSHPVLNPFKRFFEDCVFPLSLLPLSIVAGAYFLFTPLYGEEFILEKELNLPKETCGNDRIANWIESTSEARKEDLEGTESDLHKPE